ncbi:MAG: hypothetical protein R3A12_12360 [Ignavibacteria bacterium]
MNLGLLWLLPVQILSHSIRHRVQLRDRILSQRSIILEDFELPTSFSLGLSYDFRLDKKNNVMLNGTYQANSFFHLMIITLVQNTTTIKLFTSEVDISSLIRTIQVTEPLPV